MLVHDCLAGYRDIIRKTTIRQVWMNFIAFVLLWEFIWRLLRGFVIEWVHKSSRMKQGGNHGHWQY